PAEQFARASGREVTAPTELMWSDPQGTEYVSSRTRVGSRWVMTYPPDGQWRTFGPAGEILPGSSSHPAPGISAAGHPAPGQPTPGHPAPGPTRLVDSGAFVSRDDPPRPDPQHTDQQHTNQQQHDNEHEHHHDQPDDPTVSHPDTADSPEWTWENVDDLIPAD